LGDLFWDPDQHLLGTPILSGGHLPGTRAATEDLLLFQGVGVIVVFLAATAAARGTVPDPH
jgi:hypothetical protein